jgi:hypothetical protein
MLRMILFCLLGLLVCLFSSSVSCAEDKASFLQYANHQGDGADFQTAILLADTADYDSCPDLECVQEVFEQSVFKAQIEYATQTFGKPRFDWEISGHSEVTAYAYGNSRYYDDLGIREIATGRKHVLHFDITSAVDSLRKKEYALDPKVAQEKWDTEIP